AARGAREGDGEAPDVGPGAGRQSAGTPVAARRADRRPAMADARSAPAPPAHAGRGEAAPLAGEPGPAGAGRLRGPPLDRFRDPGPARWARREPAGGPSPAPRELPAGVSAALGESQLVHAASAGSATARSRRGAAGRAPGGRRGPRAPQTHADRADGG